MNNINIKLQLDKLCVLLCILSMQDVYKYTFQNIQQLP